MECFFEIYGLHCYNAPKNWSYPEESHGEFEINFVIEGVQIKTIEDVEYHQTPGDVVLLSPKTLHSSRTENSNNLIYICFHFDIDNMHFRETIIRNNINFYSAESELSLRLTPLFKNLYKDYFNFCTHKNTNKISLVASSFEILLNIYEWYITKAQKCDTKIDTRKNDTAYIIKEKIEDSLKLSENKVHHSELISKIYTELGISSSSAIRVFQKLYGMNPSEYFYRLKLKEAKKLLQNPELSVKEVAMHLGYKSVEEFCKQFKLWSSGHTPNKYKKNGAEIFLGTKK